MMGRFLVVAVFLAGLSVTAAFAMKDNGKVNASMMANGDVMMKIQLPPKEYYVIDRSMKDNHMNCRLEDFPGQSFTKILECGPNI
jgi:hypothetical protein